MGGGGIKKQFKDTFTDIARLGKGSGSGTGTLSRALKGKPEGPPQPDTAMDILVQRGLMERLKKQAIRGGGIQGSIATSQAGITGITPTIVKRLIGA